MSVILGCIDSRSATELIFDQGFGDIVSIRIAGNVVNEDILGSIEFAVERGAHQGCTALPNNAESNHWPSMSVSTNMQSLFYWKRSEVWTRMGNDERPSSHLPLSSLEPGW